jgi:SAM-dependent methyltransferase
MASITTANTPASNPITRDWFREWFDSPFYHKLYFERNDKEAADFIDRLLALLMPPAGSFLLDVACGRGRHARILSQKGFDVTGIDLAPDTIAFANQYANDHLHFYVHDMRHLLCTNCFDYAFNFFTSFGYFETQREHLNAIHTIATALRPKGVFVLDYLNAPHIQANLVPNETKTIGDTTYTITRWCDGKHFYKRIVISDKTLTSPLEYTEKVAVFLPKDFEALFEPNGLRIRQLYGNYEMGPYNPEQSPRLLIIAEKKA